MFVGNAVVFEFASGRTLLLSPTGDSALRIKISENYSDRWVVITPAQEKLILDFLLARAPRPAVPVKEPVKADAYWTPERRAEQAAEMRTIRLAQLATKGSEA